MSQKNLQTIEITYSVRIWSSLLNPQVHNFVPYLALLLGWARVLHNSNYITIQLYNYITLQLYTHIYTSTYIYPYNLLSPPDHFPNYVTVYDCRMLLGLRGLHACPWRYPWTVLCVLRKLKLTGLHFPWHSRSFQTPHFHSDLKFLKIICRNNQRSIIVVRFAVKQIILRFNTLFGTPITNTQAPTDLVARRQNILEQKWHIHIVALSGTQIMISQFNTLTCINLMLPVTCEAFQFYIMISGRFLHT